MTDDSKLKHHLVVSNLLTEEQILRAEDYALTMKMPLDEAIVFLEMLDYKALGKGMAGIYSKPYCSLLEGPPPDEAKTKVPLKVAERLRIFPVNYILKENILTLAVHDPEDKDFLATLRNSFPPPVEIAFTIASEPEIRMAIDVHYKDKVYAPDLALEVPEEFTISAHEIQPDKELNLEEAHQSDRHILLLEPDIDRARALTTLLKKEGFSNVKRVGSQGEGIDVIRTESVDMVLANSRVFKAHGSWGREISQEIDTLPPVSYYDINSLLLGHEHPYNQMSDALTSLVAFVVRRNLKDEKEQLQEIIARVRYCKLLALRLGLSPAQVDGTILAAWLSHPGPGELLLEHMTTPYRLKEILKPEETTNKKERIETSILALISKYQILKKINPEVTKEIDTVRKELAPQFTSPEDKALLESFLNVIRDEEFLKGVEQSAGRILLVDPVYAQDSSIALRLSNDGYEVTGAIDASKAAKIILKSGTDLVISEVHLPVTDGMKFCQALRKNPKTAQIPFFFLTAEEGERLGAECLEAGADDFLKKPVDLEILSLKIQRILDVKTSKETKRGISGTLTDMSTSDIIQSLTTGDKNVEVNLESRDQRGYIYIQEGEIVHARTGDIEGEGAFYRLMAWNEGEFEIVSCSAFPSRTIHGSTMSLLMEGARLADEIDNAEEVEAP